ncbi:1-phosphofructokinase [Alkalibacter rhizosphaerae]|uniref:Tagatose-6-phosphate kinase n=1 Tax=Alkalibacter rhizosphaerae TaxID=2815577 RepID=A0A974XIF9_9FIRM|nr:1-phosphofructokinase [Alkalibacter rhizosphaerae]QSX09345.1 1-phosphofructokinase [Alkalibacter rhizosphaerae]
MVITVTLNPALDKTLVVNNFAVGEVNRVQAARDDIGGKGLNVSKVLKEFGIQSLALGFLGNNLRDRFEKDLDTKGIDHRFISISSGTRTNIKLVDEKKRTFTDINEPGGAITPEELEEFLTLFQQTIKKGDLVVLAGGVGEGVPITIYKTLTGLAKRKGATVVVDAEGKLLGEALTEHPDVIKPNEKELSTLVGRTLQTEEQIVQAIKEIQEMGIDNILVSMGSEGSIYLTPNGAYRAEGLQVPVKSTVGAGDSMVAALVYSILNERDDINTLALAQSAGAASVMLEGTKACNLSQAESLMERALMKIRRI